MLAFRFFVLSISSSYEPIPKLQRYLVIEYFLIIPINSIHIISISINMAQEAYDHYKAMDCIRKAAKIEYIVLYMTTPKPTMKRMTPCRNTQS